MLTEKIIKKGKHLYTRGVQETPDNSIKRDKKSISRLKIQEEVFDDKDSIADNAKMNSLLLSMFSRLYEVQPQEVLDTLQPEDKAVMEYAINKFKGIQTRADVQFADEGLAFIDRLMDRQEQIAVLASE